MLQKHTHLLRAVPTIHTDSYMWTPPPKHSTRGPRSWTHVPFAATETSCMSSVERKPRTMSTQPCSSQNMSTLWNDQSCLPKKQKHYPPRYTVTNFKDTVCPSRKQKGPHREMVFSNSGHWDMISLGPDAADWRVLERFNIMIVEQDTSEWRSPSGAHIM